MVTKQNTEELFVGGLREIQNTDSTEHIGSSKRLDLYSKSSETLLHGFRNIELCDIIYIFQGNLNLF